MDLNELYTEVVLAASRDMTNKRELADADIHEHGHNPSCGDEITLQLRGDKNIDDLAYTGTGCAISQASTSIMIDTVKGLSKEESLKLADDFLNMVRGEELSEDEMDALGDAAIFENMKNLPARIKCATLPWYTLKYMLEKKDDGK